MVNAFVVVAVTQAVLHTAQVVTCLLCRHTLKIEEWRNRSSVTHIRSGQGSL